MNPPKYEDFFKENFGLVWELSAPHLNDWELLFLIILDQRLHSHRSSVFLILPPPSSPLDYAAICCQKGMQQLNSKEMGRKMFDKKRDTKIYPNQISKVITRVKTTQPWAGPSNNIWGQTRAEISWWTGQFFNYDFLSFAIEPKYPPQWAKSKLLN